MRASGRVDPDVLYEGLLLFVYIRCEINSHAKLHVAEDQFLQYINKILNDIIAQSISFF